MRLIGHLPNEREARTLSDYLYSRAIENQVEPEEAGWALWVHDEEEIAEAQQFLEDYRRNPSDPRFVEAGRVAVERRAQVAQAEELARKRFHDSRRVWPTQYGVGGGRVTLTLILLSVAVTLFSSFGSNLKVLNPFNLTAYQVSGEYIKWVPGLPEICHGQIWRLFTPAFIHFGPLHILFDMMWLHFLGGMVERRQGSRTLLLLFLGIAATSNLGQYWIAHSPSFGGMSGVVYGLLGYIWLRGKFDPASGLFLDSTTVTIMVVWFFLCLFGVIGHIANGAHGVGLAVGMVWGYLSAQWAIRRGH